MLFGLGADIAGHHGIPRRDQIEVAESLPVRTIGAVLNCVRGRGAFRYYTYDMAGYTEPAPDELASGPRRDSWRKVLGGRS